MAHTRIAWHQLALAADSPATELLLYDFGTLSACAVLGALLPDLDASESKIKHLKILGTNFKPFLLPAQVVHRTDQHRGLLHSLWGLGMAILIVAPVAFWIGWAPVVALLLGYASHLLGDSVTKSGIRLLYPSKVRFYLLPPGFRFTTGTFAEEALLVPLALLASALLLSSLF